MVYTETNELRLPIICTIPILDPRISKGAQPDFAFLRNPELDA
jgi:hypothetical protein